MKIAIDTKQDSAEDIKKVIRMLQHLVGEYTNDTGTVASEPKEGLFNLFDQPAPESPESKDSTETFKVAQFLEEDEKKEEDSRIVPYS